MQFLRVQRAASRTDTGISVLQSPGQRLHLPTQDVEQTRVLAGLEH